MRCLYAMLGLLVLVLSASCVFVSEDAGVECGSDSVVAESIIGGSSTSMWLGIGASSSQWVLKVSPEITLASEKPICTGVAISSVAFLSSSHCYEGGALVVTEEKSGEETAIRVAQVFVHPRLPVVLGLLDAESSKFSDFTELASAELEERLGSRVVSAGYGENERKARRLNFSVAELARISSEYLITTTHGMGGPCNGDSGSPLVVRTDAGGAIGLLGVLRGGSRDCSGVDVYVRSSRLRAWIEEHAGLENSQPVCGVLDARGRCGENAAMWCQNGALRADECGPGLRCGWSSIEAGYRCVPDNGDHCLSIDDFGLCEDNENVHCFEGVAKIEDCSSCGTSCVYSITGYARCGLRQKLPLWTNDFAQDAARISQ